MKGRSSLIVGGNLDMGMDRRTAVKLFFLVFFAPFVIIALGANFTDQARVVFESLGWCKCLPIYLFGGLYGGALCFFIKQFQ